MLGQGRVALVRTARRLAGSALLLFATSSTVGAATIPIDFEGFADGTALTTQYSGLTFSNAVILTSGISLNEMDFPPFSGTNVVSDEGGTLALAFATPVTSFGGFVTYTTQLTLSAFDASHTLLISAVTDFGHNEALSGEPGSSANELLLISASQIAFITLAGDLEGGSFALDNIVYVPTDQPQPTDVPEPSTLGLLLLGGIARIRPSRLIRIRKRKQLGSLNSPP